MRSSARAWYSDQRPELQAAIGREAEAEAEALAWLFCAIGKQHCVIVAVQEAAAGTPLSGLLLASAHQYSFANDFMAQIDYLYVLPAKRGTPAAMKMMAGFKRWAGNCEVGEISMANRFGANQDMRASCSESWVCLLWAGCMRCGWRGNDDLYASRHVAVHY